MKDEASLTDPLTLTEARHRRLVDNISSIVLRWGPEGRVKFLNEYGQRFFGYSADEIVGRSVLGLIVPETESSGRDLTRMIHDLLKHPERYATNENENMRANGERVWVTWTNRPIFDEDGNLVEILSTGIDTTERRRAEEALRESERRYRVLFQSTPVALLERDASALKAYLDRLRASGVTDVGAYVRQHPEVVAECGGLVQTRDLNTAALELFEAPDRQTLDAHLASPEHAGLGRWARATIPLVAAHAFTSREGEETIRTLQGNTRNVVVRATVVPGHEESLSRVILAMVDITERKRAEDHLRFLSTHDSLTGLYNTRYLFQALGELIDASAAAGRRFSLVFIDVDRFKRVVDTYGHLNGSRVIQEVGATVREALADPAFAVAYAGDEFIVVLPDTDEPQAIAKAEDLRARISRAVYLCKEGYRVTLTVSLGVATYPDDATDLRALLALADRALFDVKASGRDGVRASRGTDPSHGSGRGGAASMERPR
jgi:diguanylate cyclase (GGDEF)-like protein/PAS domain S-box-containing protein